MELVAAWEELLPGFVPGDPLAMAADLAPALPDARDADFAAPPGGVLDPQDVATSAVAARALSTPSTGRTERSGRPMGRVRRLGLLWVPGRAVAFTMAG